MEKVGESGNDTMNDTDNKSSMHGHGADARTGNMALEHLDQYDNESVNDSENDPAKCHHKFSFQRRRTSSN